MLQSDLAWLTDDIKQTWQRHSERVQSLYAGSDTDGPVAIFGLMAGRSHGLWGTNEPDMLADPEGWLDDVLADMTAHGPYALDHRTFRPFVIELDAFGTHYVDALFGAPVYYHEGQAWSEQLPIDPGDLEQPDVRDHAVYTGSMHLAKSAVQRSEGAVWISNPVLSCPINIGLNLFGGRLLEAMADRPAAARHALGVITDVIAECMAAFRDIIPEEQRQNSVGATRWAPPGHGFIDGCATQLISAEHYREFLAPLDARLLATYPKPGMIHLCGGHVQHIETWRDMPELRSVQVNDRAADDFERYWRGLREDQIVYITPTETMTAARVLAMTGGRRVVLQAELP